MTLNCSLLPGYSISFFITLQYCCPCRLCFFGISNIFLECQLFYPSSFVNNCLVTPWLIALSWHGTCSRSWHNQPATWCAWLYPEVAMSPANPSCWLSFNEIIAAEFRWPDLLYEGSSWYVTEIRQTPRVLGTRQLSLRSKGNLQNLL